MAHRVATALCLASSLCGCSLLVQFDPEGQPCSSRGECLTGYACLDGGCVKGNVPDSGASCGATSCTAGQRCQLGACVSCAAPETTCDDGQDNDCDGQIDCADSDCLTRACNDGSGCTVGETCGSSGCTGGAQRTCNSPGTCQVTPGTCEPATGACTYANAGVNTACNDLNACTIGDRCDGDGGCRPTLTSQCNNPPGPCFLDAGTCDPQTGGCTYGLRGDGTACGTFPSQRCCTGNCVDISSNATNCGGCGIACVAGYSCQTVSTTALVCAPAPANTSGRCTCSSALPNTCPAGQACRAQAANGGNLCAPPDAGPGCVTGERVQIVLNCPNYCTY